jgi:hypothetical protein
MNPKAGWYILCSQQGNLVVGRMKKIDERESVFFKKLKIKLKYPGKKGRAELLKDYLDYLISKNKTIPPDFPTFVREILGLDERGGFLHIKIWHEKSELVEFVRTKKYEYRIEHYG